MKDLLFIALPVGLFILGAAAAYWQGRCDEKEARRNRQYNPTHIRKL